MRPPDYVGPPDAGPRRPSLLAAAALPSSGVWVARRRPLVLAPRRLHGGRAPAGGGSAVRRARCPRLRIIPAVCAPVGADDSTTCVRLTLQAIDDVRAKEVCAPRSLPVRLPDADRPGAALRGDRPRTGRPGARPPRRPDHRARRRRPEGVLRSPDSRPAWPGVRLGQVRVDRKVDNGLDADFQWLYDDGPDSGVPGARRSGPPAAGPTVGPSSATSARGAS